MYYIRGDHFLNGNFLTDEDMFGDCHVLAKWTSHLRWVRGCTDVREYLLQLLITHLKKLSYVVATSLSDVSYSFNTR